MDISNFKIETRPRYKGEYENTCRGCKIKANERYRNTEQGFLKGLLKNARKSGKKRIEKGRAEAGEFDLTYDDVLDILDKQNKRCYYSNVPLVFKKKSDYQASLERLDTSKGYTKSNVVVCCLEFNDVMQWTKEKIREMYDTLQVPHDCSDTNFDLIKKPRRRMTAWAKYDKQLFHQCNKCLEVKPLAQFNKNRAIGCKDCIKVLDKQRMEEPRSAMLALIRAARSNTKKRQKKSTAVDRDFIFDLTFDELVDIYRSQRGLCAYSGLPLRFGNSTEISWKMSLERIDAKKGYTRINVCLIAYEFNTGDKRILYNDDSDGSCAWSAEKFRTVFDHIGNMFSG